MAYEAVKPLLVCYKLPNTFDSGYDLKIVESWLTPVLEYEIAFDDIRYVIEEVEVRQVGGNWIFFTRLAITATEEFVDEHMKLKIAEHLLIQQPEKR